MRCMSASIVVVLALVAGAPAVASDTWDNQIRAQLFRGDIPEVIKVLKDGALEGMASEPALLLRTAKTLHQYVYRTVRHDAKAATQLFDLLVERTAKVRDARPVDRTAREAWAYFAATRARSRLLQGDKKAQPEWVEAADILLGHRNREDSTIAAGWIAAAAACQAADEQALLARARTVLAETWAKESDAQRKAVALAHGHVQRAEALIHRRALGAAKREIAGGVALLAPYEKDADDELAAVREELASLNHAKRLKVKGAAFKTQRIVSRENTLVVDVPASPRWERKAGSKGGADLWLNQKNRHGEIIRAIQVNVYKWKSTVQGDGGPRISTENAKALAHGLYSTNARSCGVSEILSQKKPKKSKLHKSLTDVYRSELVGLVHDDKWRSFHIYWCRSKQLRRTYKVTVENYIEPLDGAATFVLMNLCANVKK